MSDYKDLTLPAIKAAEEILIIAAKVTEPDLSEAMEKASMASSTWGLLWGNPINSISRLDADFIDLKLEVLRFIESIQKKKAFNFARILAIRRAEGVL